MADEQVTYTLDPDEQVTRWYNIVADLPTPLRRPCTRRRTSRWGPRIWRRCSRSS
ncbi:hypothetical protein [Homoserinibacter gongjuensis]|uniref:Uncharacterized protein n=1 Tax=Homoserinibacter gongjuensis TaxID=1162968 RepID=A0ABQ6JR29_9MICO|nr:hypothetical protein [Homoserinibacter gongjuensis]GMA89971.1 hypothetical protein GCM10025869_05000 [Homoserinibacter gongjuensis]